MYRELSGVQDADLTPKDIYEIAEGIKEGDKKAAIASFQELGEMAGSAIASALNIVDGLVVIGGGLAGASHYILPALVNELRATLSMFSGEQFPCLQMEVYNWEAGIRFLYTFHFSNSPLSGLDGSPVTYPLPCRRKNCTS